MHITRTPLSTDAPFSLDDVKLHTRVSFDDDDAALAVMAWAAAREIEAHCALALMSQQIVVTLDRWTQRISLPIGPLYAAGLTANPITVEALAEDGTASLVTGFYAMPGRYPALVLTETVAAAGLRIVYPAGFGVTVEAIPEDLQLAIMDQAARSYDLRGAEDGKQGLSLAASRIAARYRKVAVA